MNEGIVRNLRNAADKWEQNHPIIGVGELRVHEALRDAARCIEETSAKVPRWISVKERLPRCGERVLVTNGGFVWEAYLSISHKWVRQEFVWAAKVTHWMPLPEPPKEDESC